MKPLQKHKILSIATSCILLTEFLFFLLVALSVPIIKTIYLLGLNSITQPGQPVTSVATKLRFGVWGLCAHSANGNAEWLDPNGVCYGPSVGYKIPQSVLDVTGYAQLAQVVLEGLTVLLILHPVVAVLSFIGAATSLYLESHAMHIISLIITIVNSFLSSIVFAADLAINIVARDRIPSLAGVNLVVLWGNGVWLVLVGVFLSWLGVILLSIPICQCCGMSDIYNAWEGRRRGIYQSGRSEEPRTREKQYN